MTRPSLLSIPSGVQCFFGPEARLRREIERRVADVFRGWSYEEIVLPLFDYDEVFSRGGGPSASGGIYRFVGRDGEVLALRRDFTALVAKIVVSRLASAELPLRLFYSGEVLRYQPPRAGQQEELFQIGLEHLGDGAAADVEVLLVACEALDRLGASDARLTLGHVGYVLGLLAGAEPAERDLALAAMRRRDRDGLRAALGEERARPLVATLGFTGGLEALNEAEKLAASDESARALARLREVAGSLRDLGLEDRLRLDLGEVRGFDYYTGLVFEIHAEGAGLELGGGGRYDSLVARFGRDVPAVGFYLSLDRLAELVAKRGGLDPPPEPRGVAIDGASAEAFRTALEARRRGERVRISKR
jgi:ATP phosphoribosyltransferase regulatory subunit